MTKDSHGLPVDRVFGWSFYNQGTGKDGMNSAEPFVAKALTFFGDADLATSNVDPWSKGVRLATLVAERPSLLVLDGLESLQYPPGPSAGRLKDLVIGALLTTLAGSRKQTFAGSLCVITSRESVADLVPFNRTSAPEFRLDQLSDDAGACVLHRAGATRAGVVRIPPTDSELRAASHEFGGHALTLQLVGSYLGLAAEGDIRRRKEVHLSDADLEYKINPANVDKPYGDAFEVVGAYAKWLAEGGEDGSRLLSILRIMGLFDRPADPGCVGVLRKVPAIPGLTEQLVNLTDFQWNIAISRLASCGLLLAKGNGGSIDAHPLVREYFAKQLSEQHPEAWKAAHQRLFEYLRDNTPAQLQPTLDELQPLYQGVAHGCKAGLYLEASEVFGRRIRQGATCYSCKRLGAYGADLGAIACFFQTPFSRFAQSFPDKMQAWLLNEAAFCLRPLGRLNEAVDPERASVEICVRQEDWEGAALRSGNLSELELMLGRIAGAVKDAEDSVIYADKGSNTYQHLTRRATLANALHQAGQRDKAEELFKDAESRQAGRWGEPKQLYSLPGFCYCDLLLAVPERAAWQLMMNAERGPTSLELLYSCDDVERRAARAIEWDETKMWNGQNQANPLTVARDYLTRSRSMFCFAFLNGSSPAAGRPFLERALSGLRSSASQHELPRGLLIYAWWSFVEATEHKLLGQREMAADCESRARAGLDEAWQIAERGAMKLFQTDIHLNRARLFFRHEPYPWQTPQHDLAAAEQFINDCGYHRRDEEIADAKKAILGS